VVEVPLVGTDGGVEAKETVIARFGRALILKHITVLSIRGHECEDETHFLLESSTSFAFENPVSIT
jgi:hypothetical protein